MKHIRYRKSKYYHYIGVRKSVVLISAFFLALLLAGCLFIYLGFGQEALITSTGESITPTPTSIPIEEARKPLANTAWVTWYGTGEDECLGCKKFYDENGLFYLMSDKDRLDDERFTVAHRTLPFGTKVKFLRDEGDGSGRVVEAVVTDRGNTYDFDLSKAVFERVGRLSEGKILVRWEVVE